MKPREILPLLEDYIGLDGPPRRLRDAIEELLIDRSSISPMEAAELADSLCPKLRKLIAEKELEAQAYGLMCKVSLVGFEQSNVVGSCRVFPSDTAQIASIKSNRLQLAQLLEAIRGLTPAEFETFGARVLKQIGAKNFYVTPISNDGGIDFYGTMNLGGIQNLPTSFFHLAHGIDIHLAGQAKHYPDRSLGPSVVRELIGSLELARYKAQTNSSPFENIRIRPFDPLLALVFTTGDVTTGTRELSLESGVIVCSGIQLAIYLADCGVGMELDQQGAKIFNHVLFRAWLDG